MNTTRTQGVIAAALMGALAFAATVSHAQDIDTRIGKLEVVNGFPTTEAAKKLFDESDFQRATQSYLWALPAVGFHGLHLSHLNIFGAKDGEIVFYVSLKDKAGMLTPNLTTIYAMSFWDLAKQGPLVIIVPAGASAGGVLDIWQRPITDVGQTGPDKGQGGKYLILPPGGPDIVNPEFIVRRSQTNQVWFATAARTSTSGRKRPRENTATGSRPFPARGISPSSGFTARPKPPSTRAGNQVMSSW